MDAAKALAICAVMGIHAFYIAAWVPGLALPEWSVATFANNALRFAVPAFLFFSGFCLGTEGDGRGGWRGFYLRKIRRVFIPYAVVSTVLVVGGIDGFGPAEQLSPQKAGAGALVEAILTGGACVPFYFVVVLGQLYAIYPLLLKLAARSPFLLAGGCLLASAAGTTLLTEGELWGIPVFFPYLFPFALGMLSSGRSLRAGRAGGWWAIVAAYGCANFVVLKIALGGQAGFDLTNWYTYNSQYFYSTAVAVLSVRVLSVWPSVVTLLAPMGRISLWIFLLHYPIQVWAWGLLTPSGSTQAFLMATGVWAGGTVLSLTAGAGWARHLKRGRQGGEAGGGGGERGSRRQ